MTDQSATPNGQAPDARIEQFRNDVEDMKLKGSSGEGEKWFLIIGVVLLVAGVVLAIVGAVTVANAGGSPADQRANMAQGSFMGIALAIVGAALFLRYSLARYLRFWLIRLTYESRANTDRLVAAIERAAGQEPVVAATPPVVGQPAAGPAPAAAPAPAASTPPPFTQG